jgi:hypothetical protein
MNTEPTRAPAGPDGCICPQDFVRPDCPVHGKAKEAESELGRSAALIGEIVDARATGNFESTLGNSDEDLLGAVEEFEDNARVWRARTANAL